MSEPRLDEELRGLIRKAAGEHLAGWEFGPELKERVLARIGAGDLPHPGMAGQPSRPARRRRWWHPAYGALAAAAAVAAVVVWARLGPAGQPDAEPETQMQLAAAAAEAMETAPDPAPGPVPAPAADTPVVQPEADAGARVTALDATPAAPPAPPTGSGAVVPGDVSPPAGAGDTVGIAQVPEGGEDTAGAGIMAFPGPGRPQPDEKDAVGGQPPPGPEPSLVLTTAGAGAGGGFRPGDTVVVRVRVRPGTQVAWQGPITVAAWVALPGGRADLGRETLESGLRPGDPDLQAEFAWDLALPEGGHAPAGEYTIHVTASSADGRGTEGILNIRVENP